MADSDTYVLIKKDPIKKRQLEGLCSLDGELKVISKILNKDYKALYCNDGLLPRVYGLPKIHKPGCLLKIIVPSVGSPLYSLITFLHNRLFKIIPKANSYIKNSFDLVDKLRILLLVHMI